MRRGVDLLHRAALDQAQRGVARGGDEIEAAAIHQRDHFVRAAGGLHRDLAAGFLFEAGHPVVILVGFTALDIARPGDDGDFAFALADALQRLGLGGDGCPAPSAAATAVPANFILTDIFYPSLLLTTEGAASTANAGRRIPSITGESQQSFQASAKPENVRLPVSSWRSCATLPGN